MNSLIETIMDVESDETAQMVRMLILLEVFRGKRGNMRVDGITKLAIFDFLLKYPEGLQKFSDYCCSSDLNALNMNLSVSDYESNSIETDMMRFAFSPWDSTPRKSVAILIAKSLVLFENEKKKTLVSITNRGIEITEKLYEYGTYKELQTKSQTIKRLFGGWTQGKLMNQMYLAFPEFTQMRRL